MPDASKCPSYSQCQVCASSEDPPSGPFPSFHSEVCCLHKFSRKGKSSKEEGIGSCSTDGSERIHGCGGICKKLCKKCPLRVKLHQPSKSTADSASRINLHPLTEGEAVPEAERNQGQLLPRRPQNPQKGVRKRKGQKNTKSNLEIRPPKFKQKLWFGTYSDTDIPRATDAMMFFTRTPNPKYNFIDSPQIFGHCTLGIHFEDLDISCDTTIIPSGGNKPVLKHLYFAREVRRVVKKVIAQEFPPTQKMSKRVKADHDTKPSQTYVARQDPPIMASFNFSTSCSAPSPVKDMSRLETSDLSASSTFISAPESSDTFEDISDAADSSRSPPLLTETPTMDEESNSIDNLIKWEEMVSSPEGISKLSSLPSDLVDGTDGPTVDVQHFSDFEMFLHEVDSKILQKMWEAVIGSFKELDPAFIEMSEDVCASGFTQASRALI